MVQAAGHRAGQTRQLPLATHLGLPLCHRGAYKTHQQGGQQREQHHQAAKLDPHGPGGRIPQPGTVGLLEI